MKKFLSIALLFSAVTSQAAWREWVAPVGVPAAVLAAKYVNSKATKKNATVEKTLDLALAGSVTETSKRVVSELVKPSAAMFKTSNSLKDVVVDSALNTGLLAFGQSKYNVLPGVVSDYSVNHSVVRSLLVCVAKHYLSALASGVASKVTSSSSKVTSAKPAAK